MILNDLQILSLCNEGMLTPHVTSQMRTNADGAKVVSYGPSSFGYDIRLSNEFIRFYTEDNPIMDPHQPDLNPEPDHFEAERVIIEPGHMLLGRSLETFNMPRDVTGICLGKSTYARLALEVNMTPLEAGWKGTLTIEMSNIGHIPIAVYAYEGIAQVLFFKGTYPKVSYADRNGKYQNQLGVQVARL